MGDLVDGTVTKIVNFGAFVRVKDGLEGLIHISELSHQRVAHPGDVVHEGQTLQLKIISLDSERHRLGLSLKQAEEAPARPPRERRPRTERAGYDRSQAIQEPEGGIDNTLAAAFAQVRLQIAEQDAAEPEQVAEAVEVADAIDSDAAEPEAFAEPIAEPEALADTAEVEQVAEAVEFADAIDSAAPEAEVEVEPAEVEGAAGAAEVVAEVDAEVGEVDEAAESVEVDLVEPAEVDDTADVTDKA